MYLIFTLLRVKLTWGICWWGQKLRNQVPKGQNHQNHPFFGLEILKISKFWFFLFFFLKNPYFNRLNAVFKVSLVLDGKASWFFEVCLSTAPLKFCHPHITPPRCDWPKKIFMSEQLHRVVLYTKNEKNRRGDGATPGWPVSEFPSTHFALLP